PELEYARLQVKRAQSKTSAIALMQKQHPVSPSGHAQLPPANTQSREMNSVPSVRPTPSLCSITVALTFGATELELEEGSSEISGRGTAACGRGTKTGVPHPVTGTLTAKIPPSFANRSPADSGLSPLTEATER
ncbi:hypothetical protein P7K49_007247, partial [Saguinus oedipus]